MKKSERMLPLRKLAEGNEKQAAQALGVIQTSLQAEHARLNELKSFKEDYKNKLHAMAKSGISGAQLQQYHLFIGKLDVTIEQQHQRILQLDVKCQSARKSWYEKHNRTQALDKGIARYVSQESKEGERKTQREVEDNYQARFNTKHD